jgi:membrane protease YdiL (CAAX protease family)
MTTNKAFIKRYPVLTYYVLTFAISWGCVLLAIGGPGGIPANSEQFERLLPVMIMALLAGPTIAGLLLTGLVYGKAGIRELLSRLLRWRVSVRWYGVALLAAPLLFIAIPLVLSLFFPEFLPGIFITDDKASLLLMGIAAGLSAGIFEELGWTGFAVPKLRLRYSVLTTGLIVGFLWGAWHFLVNFWSSGRDSSSGALSLALLLTSLLFSIGILPAFRVLMVWVYDRTGSLLVAMLMHLSLTASNVILAPLATGVLPVIWVLVLAAALWIVVAAVAVANRGQLSRQPLQRQVA